MKQFKKYITAIVISFFILGMVALVLVFTDKTVILLKEGSAEKPESE